jgi:tetratricopeptide (TPR) repeat protein
LKKLFLLFLFTFLFGCQNNKRTAVQRKSYLNYQIADSLFRQDNDSAFYYYNEVVTGSQDRLEKARAYNRMATIQFNSGDHFGSQETATESQKLLDEKLEADHPYLLSNYNLLGRSYLEQKNYDAAVSCFSKASELQGKGQVNATLLNNLALAYQNKKDFNQAKRLFQLAIDSSKNDTLNYARALSNLERTKWLEDSSYYASPELLKALNLRDIKKERRGLNASYGHLADYYFRSRPDSSLFYAKRKFSVAQSPDDILDAIEQITRVGTPRDTKEYSVIYYRLRDSLDRARNTARNQFAAIRFETEKNKSDNLRLQRNNFRQRVYIYAIIAGFILLVFVGVTFYLRRKRRIEKEAADRIRDSELKTSKKVHDVVANGLYRIMADLEHRDSMNKDAILDEIEVLYEQSRDISYEKSISHDPDYALQIHRLLSTFGTNKTKVLIVGNQEKLWRKITLRQKTELEYVLQELMVNMSKHSRAQNVVIKFTDEGDLLNIHYKDDGIGLLATTGHGNGLQNTENRIKSLGGSIIFDGISGLKLEISLPTVKTND